MGSDIALSQQMIAMIDAWKENNPTVPVEAVKHVLTEFCALDSDEADRLFRLINAREQVNVLDLEAACEMSIDEQVHIDQALAKLSK